MNTIDETGERINLSLHHPVRIVTGEAHLPVGTVADQKILGDSVDRLNVRRVAGGAFDIAVDEFHGAGGISRLALRRQRRHQVRCVFDGQDKTERMRAGERGAE